jgi:Na+-translocating ferredoxin:NAD+ oxidoreductase RNF subunit RnfB
MADMDAEDILNLIPNARCAKCGAHGHLSDVLCEQFDEHDQPCGGFLDPIKSIANIPVRRQINGRWQTVLITREEWDAEQEKEK